jgi:hypothetical protein
MSKAIALGGLALCFSLATPSAISQQQSSLKPAPQQIAQAKKPDVSQDILAKMQSAKEKLTSARNDLINSGGEWGGFRESAIKDVDEALANVNKALEYRQSDLKK